MTTPTPTPTASAANALTPASTDGRGRFVWHECMTSDPARAQAFYGAVLGWGTQPFEGMPYTMFTANGVPQGGYFAITLDMAERGVRPSWLTYIGTPDVDAAAAELVAAGGAVRMGPDDIPGVGRFAVVADPQGALFALFRGNQEMSPAAATPGLGEASWHELATTDGAAAQELYGRLFGWQKVQDMDMGPELGLYRLFGLGAQTLGGIYDKPASVPMPPNWCPYFRVADVHAAAEAVQANGGAVLHGPTEVPGGDLIAQCTDPLGAFFAVHEVRNA